MRFLLATQNEGKVKEIKRILQPLGFDLLLPREEVKVEEKGNSFMENAYTKAMAYFERYHIPTLADDSGLVVPALEGYPGVFSSRFHSVEWGGMEPIETTEDQANIKKLLRLLENKRDKRAYFKAVVCLVMAEDFYVFAEGVCEGEIVDSPRGSGGFGYDPIFRPFGYEKTMAELSSQEKDKISHRGKALKRLMEFINACKHSIFFQKVHTT